MIEITVHPTAAQASRQPTVTTAFPANCHPERVGDPTFPTGERQRRVSRRRARCFAGASSKRFSSARPAQHDTYGRSATDRSTSTAPLPYDIYFTGVGGQGVLTIGEIITEAAFRRGIPVNFFPTKGMAQRGGFVKAQLRMGRAVAGPSIPERGAHLLIATEVSEALKAVRYCRPDADFVLYAAVWAPTAVMLGKAPYPTLDQVQVAVHSALHDGGCLHTILPEQLPAYDGAPVPDNIYTLAFALKRTLLGQVLPPAEVLEIIRTRWHRGVERNLAAFQAGLDAAR